MNKIIKDNYDLDIIGVIKITDKVYRLKTKENKYFCLKYIENNDESIFAHLSLINLSSFSIPIKNKNKTYITNINDQYYFLTPWYEDEMLQVKEISLKFFFDELIKLHKKSMYDSKINKGYFEEIFLKLEKEINEEEIELNDYLSNIEKLEYKSPSEWLFIMNNNRFKEAINKSKEYLSKFKESIKELDTIRVSLVYLNFDFTNILVKEEKMIGIEKIKLAPFIFDIKDLFDKSYNLSIDILMYFKLYFKEIKLLDYEKYWLLSLLSLPLIDYSYKKEIDKIINISKINYHINRSFEIEKLIKENI